MCRRIVFSSMAFICFLLLVQASEDPTPKKEASIQPHSGPVNYLDFSTQGSWLFSMSNSDKTVKLWTVPALEAGVTLKHEHPIDAATMFFNERFLATVSTDESRDLPFRNTELHIWNTEKPNKPVKTLKTGHTLGVSSMAVSIGGEILATGGNGDGTKLWDMIKMEEKATLAQRGNINALAFDWRSNILASASSQGTVKLWDTSKGTEVDTLKSDGIPPKPFRRVAFSHDGLYLVTATSESDVNRANGEITVWKRGEKPGDYREHLVLESNLKHAMALSFSINGVKDHDRILATATYDGTIKFWDVENGKEIGKLTFKEGLSAMAFNSNGRFLAVALMDKTFTVKFLDAGKLLEQKREK